MTTKSTKYSAALMNSPPPAVKAEENRGGSAAGLALSFYLWGVVNCAPPRARGRVFTTRKQGAAKRRLKAVE